MLRVSADAARLGGISLLHFSWGRPRRVLPVILALRSPDFPHRRAFRPARAAVQLTCLAYDTGKCGGCQQGGAQTEGNGAAGEKSALLPLSEKTDVGENRQREKPLTDFPTVHKKIRRLEYIPPYSPPGRGTDMGGRAALSPAAGYFKSRCWSAFSARMGPRSKCVPTFD